uniref:Carboxylic ester hydrolase n=1 Tax=Phaedon brassicae TaxID=154011 RepID=A0A9Y1PSY6_9CUCU|nr:esterase [Phaedon brassicae]WET52655.1 cholinesterase [Phaedon brassicae]WET52782.1 cholinesterase [Phaedon brassicae]
MSSTILLNFTIIIGLLVLVSGQGADDLIVKLNQPQSLIRGHALKSENGNTYYAFQDIPYGAPPVGENRFKAPKFHAGWDGVLNATQNIKSCYQFSFPSAFKRGLNQVVETEDCLILNVYTPVVPGTNKKLPVYLFIHGGAFLGGSSSNFGPKYLIEGDIIVVTINYRLGPLGFLSTEDGIVSGNMGIKDQHLALQWTHKNIELFGGNPNDIVIGGESAGAFSVSYQLLNSRNKGLISGIIQQSGTAISGTAFSANGLESRPRQKAFALGRELNISIAEGDTSSLIKALRKTSIDALITAANQVPSSYSVGFIGQPIWSPVVENAEDEQAFITTPMHQDFMEGNFNHVPSMIGFNSEESLFFLPSDEMVSQFAALNDADPSLLIQDLMNVENKTKEGIELKGVYTSKPFSEDPEAFVKFTSDAVFIRSTIRQAELSSKHAPVYLYQFSAGPNMSPQFPGIAHAAELQYLWDLSDGNGSDKTIRELILPLWWNFIKYKNPTPGHDSNMQNIEWPTVESNNIAYFNIDEIFSVSSNPRNYETVKEVLLGRLRTPYLVF